MADPNSSTSIRFPKWRVLALILGGIGLVGAAVVVAQRTHLRETFVLDWRGTTTEGSAERIGKDRYRLRYVLPTGIHARTYEGNVPFTRTEGDRLPITLVYSPSRPSDFQPRGLSYIPAAFVAVLFVSGMSCVLYARRMANLVHHPKPARPPARRKS